MNSFSAASKIKNPGATTPASILQTHEPCTYYMNTCLIKVVLKFLIQEK